LLRSSQAKTPRLHRQSWGFPKRLLLVLEDFLHVAARIDAAVPNGQSSFGPARAVIHLDVQRRFHSNVR